MKKVFQKLLNVKQKIDYIQKSTAGHNYNYASPSVVLAKLNPLLNEEKLILITEVVDVKEERLKQKVKAVDVYIDGKKQQREVDVYETLYSLTLNMRWVCTETGEEVCVKWFGSGINGDEKGFGSALTYAERYFMIKQFNIPMDNDDPDSFKDKSLTEDEREAIRRKKEIEEKRKHAQRLSKLIKDINESTTLDELMELKEVNKDVLSEKSVKNAFIDKHESIVNPKQEEVKPAEEVKKGLKKKAEVPAKKVDDSVKEEVAVVEEAQDEVVVEETDVEQNTESEPVAEADESPSGELFTEQTEIQELNLVEEIMQKGKSFKTRESISDWWKSSVSDFESKLSADEMISLKKEFAEYFKTLK